MLSPDAGKLPQPDVLAVLAQQMQALPVLAHPAAQPAAPTQLPACAAAPAACGEPEHVPACNALHGGTSADSSSSQACRTWLLQACHPEVHGRGA